MQDLARGKMKKSVEERKKRKTNEEICIESVVDNALTPKSDQHLISPDNITPKSNIRVTRQKEMIIN